MDTDELSCEEPIELTEGTVYRASKDGEYDISFRLTRYLGALPNHVITGGDWYNKYYTSGWYEAMTTDIHYLSKEKLSESVWASELCLGKTFEFKYGCDMHHNSKIEPVELARLEVLATLNKV